MKMKPINMKTIGPVLMMAVVAATGAVSAGEHSPAALHFTEYSVGTFDYPADITRGPDGALWFTDYYYGIGRITTAGVITEYSTPSVTNAITTGPDHRLWYTTGLGENRIGRISTTGRVKEWLLPRSNPYTLGITAGPGGLWFAEFNPDNIGNSYIGSITITGVITEHILAQQYVYPQGITLGPDGALWFTGDFGYPDPRVTGIGRTTTGEDLTPCPIAGSGFFTSIASGPDGALWVTDYEKNSIYRITTGCAATEYPLPNPDSHPERITPGTGQTLWFTEYDGNRIGRITTSGVITEYAIPTTDSKPLGIRLGPDRAIWFTEVAGGKIGRLGP